MALGAHLISSLLLDGRFAVAATRAVFGVPTEPTLERIETTGCGILVGLRGRCSPSHGWARSLENEAAGDDRPPNINQFEAVMERENRQRGFFVAFGYSRDAEQECAAFHRRTGRIFKLLTVSGNPRRGACAEDVREGAASMSPERERRTAKGARLLVAGELLHAQLILSTASEAEVWPHVEDVNAFLPTSAWQENRSSLAGKVDEGLWYQLVMAYAVLESDRVRFVLASRIPETKRLGTPEAESLKRASNNLGRLRRKLGLGGGWADEINDALDSLNDDFKRALDGLSDDDLKNDAVIAKVRQVAKSLGQLNRDLGDNGAWFAQIDDEIKRRSERHSAPGAS